MFNVFKSNPVAASKCYRAFNRLFKKYEKSWEQEGYGKMGKHVRRAYIRHCVHASAEFTFDCCLRNAAVEIYQEAFGHTKQPNNKEIQDLVEHNITVNSLGMSNFNSLTVANWEAIAHEEMNEWN